MRELLRLRMPAVLTSIPVAMDQVVDLAATLGFGPHALEEIRLVVDEACANVVEHAYVGREPGDMEVVCTREGNSLVIRVRDWGRGFKLEELPDPKIDAPLEERSLGGLGLFLVRHFMDRVEYTRDPEEGNELMMSKRL